MSTRWFKFVALAAVLGAMAGMFNLLFLQGYGTIQSDQVQLLAFPTKAAYVPGETISILVVLKNTSTGALGLSDQVAGTLQIVSLKRDGKSVASRTSFVTSYESLSYLLKQSIRLVGSNESIPLLLVSEGDSELGGEALGTIQLEQQGLNQVIYYAVNAPGRYELSLAYEIPALPGLAPGVFQGKTHEATMNFTVTR